MLNSNRFYSPAVLGAGPAENSWKFTFRWTFCSYSLCISLSNHFFTETAADCPSEVEKVDGKPLFLCQLNLDSRPPCTVEFENTLIERSMIISAYFAENLMSQQADTKKDRFRSEKKNHIHDWQKEVSVDLSTPKLQKTPAKVYIFSILKT